jgi:hypothetical protein
MLHIGEIGPDCRTLLLFRMTVGSENQPGRDDVATTSDIPLIARISEDPAIGEADLAEVPIVGIPEEIPAPPRCGTSPVDHRGVCAAGKVTFRAPERRSRPGAAIFSGPGQPGEMKNELIELTGARVHGYPGRR